MKLIALILVVVLVAVGAWLYEKKRSDGLERAAARLGLSFQRGQHPLPKELDEAGFYLFTQGPALARNLMRGTYREHRVLMLTYTYAAGRGDEGMRELPNSDDEGPIDNRLQTVAWLRADDLPLPDFDLSPTRGALRSVGRKFGLRPVTFDGRNDFRERYILLGRDEAAVRRHFSPRVLEFLLAHPGLTVENRGGQRLVYRSERRIDPGQIGAFLDDAAELLALLAGVDAPP